MNIDHEVVQARLRHLSQLHSLFHQGLYGDFGYFPSDYLTATDQANNFWRLGLAVIRPRRLVLVAIDRGNVVGYTITGLQANGEAFIFWVYVAQPYRSRGIGRALVEATLAELQRRDLHRVSLATHKYAEYYQHYGFAVDPAQTFVIGDTNMYIMEKDLTRP